MQGVLGNSFGAFGLDPEGAAIRLAGEIRRARRHTRVVRLLKAVLPLASVVLVVVLVLPGTVTGRLGGVNFALDAARISREGISMDNPRITGIGAKGRPFEIQARRAIQSIQNPKVVRFEEIRAKLKMDENDNTTVASRTGIYDSEHDTLKLAGDIRVRSTGGYEADLQSADIDLKRGSLRSDEPAVLRAAAGVVEGRRLVVTDNGSAVSFEGGVRMTLYPSQGAQR